MSDDGSYSAAVLDMGAMSEVISSNRARKVAGEWWSKQYKSPEFLGRRVQPRPDPVRNGKRRVTLGYYDWTSTFWVVAVLFFTDTDCPVEVIDRRANQQFPPDHSAIHNEVANARTLTRDTADNNCSHRR